MKYYFYFIISDDVISETRQQKTFDSWDILTFLEATVFYSQLQSRYTSAYFIDSGNLEADIWLKIFCY